MKRNTAEDRRRHRVLSRMLLDRQTEVEGRLRALREVMPAKDSDVKDAEEQSMADFVRDMDVALLEMECETLRRIDSALARLQEGTYGICASCEERIAEARLQALPFATLCRDCQEREEEDETAARSTNRRAFLDQPPSKQEQAGARSRAAFQADAAIRKTIRMARMRA